MSDPDDKDVTRGYTREEVEEYLRLVAERRIELQAAIEEARDRLTRAAELEHRIEALEKRVGEWIVIAHAHAKLAARSETPGAEADRSPAPGPTPAPIVPLPRRPSLHEAGAIDQDFSRPMPAWQVRRG